MSLLDRKKYLLAAFITAAVCLLTAFCSAFPATAFAQNSNINTVRIGYYESNDFQEGASAGEYKSGYAYEYYRKLSEYTGWKYEYVYGTYGELYQMMLRGEIDLLAGMTYNKDQSVNVSYPDKPMGRDTYDLVKRDSTITLSSEPSSLSGKLIGVLDTAVQNILRDYLSRNNVEANVVTFRDYETMFASFDSEELDAMVTQENIVYGNEHTEAFASIGTSDYYLCVSRSRPDLLTALNDAQNRLFSDEPDYISALRMKYYPVNASRRSISKSEKDWLESHIKLKIGYLNNYLPYSDTDSDGNVTGIIKELVPNMISKLSVSDKEIVYTGFDSYDDMVKAVGTGEVDVVFPVGGGLYYSEENGITESDPVISSSTELVYRNKYSDEKLKYFAVNKNNRMQYYYVRTNYPDAEITIYDSIDDCLDAVLKGKVGCTTLNGIRANDILRNSKYENLSLLQLSKTDDRCFGVKIGNEGLLKLLNRGIRLVGDEYTQTLAFKYAGRLYEYTFWDMLRDKLWMVILSAAMIFILIVFLLIRALRRSKKLLAEKVKAEEELAQKNSELQNSHNQTSDADKMIMAAGFGIWRIEKSKIGYKTRMFLNSNSADLFGFDRIGQSPEEIYDNWHSRIVQKDVTAVDEAFSRMRSGLFTEVTYSWVHPERGIICVRIGGVVRTDDETQEIFRGYDCDVTGIVRSDIEEKQALENALAVSENSNRAKNIYLSNMSHDIRTPMNSIINYSELAATNIDDREQVSEYLSRITVSSCHLLSLINDVLDLTRTDNDRIRIRESRVHISDIIRDIRSMIKNTAEPKMIELQIKVGELSCEDIITDKLRLDQVLLNLLSNAVKFSPAKSKVTFSIVEKHSDDPDIAALEFHVKDSGVGLSEILKDSLLFDPDYKERSAEKAMQNMGYGMAVTRNIVETMGGKISVVSKEGEGAEFIVSLWCRKCNAPVDEDRFEKYRGMRVLVADYDTGSCLSLTSMLRDQGMRADWTNYGREALVRADEAINSGDPFGAYIINSMMSDIDGIETVVSLRNIVGDEIPVIMMTARDQSDIKNKSSDAGVTVCITKPLQASELADIFDDNLR